MNLRDLNFDALQIQIGELKIRCAASFDSALAEKIEDFRATIEQLRESTDKELGAVQSLMTPGNEVFVLKFPERDPRYGSSGTTQVYLNVDNGGQLLVGKVDFGKLYGARLILTVVPKTNHE